MPEQSKTKYKSFTYSTGLTWTKDKLGMLTAEGRPSIEISSPPEFKGQAGRWTPEDVFVGAVEMCQMLTFLALAQKNQLLLLSYKSSAKGTLEFVDGQYRFTHIIITPTIVVEKPATEIDVQTLMREAHKRCLVSNSITAVVEVNPSVTVQESIIVGETPSTSSRIS